MTSDPNHSQPPGQGPASCLSDRAVPCSTPSTPAGTCRMMFPSCSQWPSPKDAELESDWPLWSRSKGHETFPDSPQHRPRPNQSLGLGSPGNGHHPLHWDVRQPQPLPSGESWAFLLRGIKRPKVGEIAGDLGPQPFPALWAQIPHLCTGQEPESVWPVVLEGM